MLDKTVTGIADVLDGLSEATELLELAESEQDEDTALAVVADLDKFQSHIEKLEFQRMFSGEMDIWNNPEYAQTLGRERSMPVVPKPRTGRK